MQNPPIKPNQIGLSKAVSDQIRIDAENQLKGAQKGGIFAGRVITWMAGANWIYALKNYFISLINPNYAEAVRNEFFNQLKEGIKESTADARELLTNVQEIMQNVSEDDLSKDKKYVLMANAYEKAKAIKEGLKPKNEVQVSEKDKLLSKEEQVEMQRYSEVMEHLKHRTVEAVKEMAIATVTTEKSKQEIQVELGNLRNQNSDEIQFAKKVIEMLIKRCGNNVENLIKLANNIDLLFENVGVQKIFTEDVKMEMIKSILIKMNTTLRFEVSDTIGKTGWGPWAFDIVHSSMANNIENFLKTGKAVEKFPEYFRDKAEEAIKQVAMKCSIEANFDELKGKIREYSNKSNSNVSEEYKAFLIAIVDEYQTRFLINLAFPNSAKIKKDFPQGSPSEYFQAVITEEIKDKCSNIKNPEELKKAFKKLEDDVKKFMQKPGVAFSEKEKQQLLREVAGLTGRVVQDKENNKPIDWLFNFEKHRGLSSKVTEKIEELIKEQIKSEKLKAKTKVTIDGLPIVLCTQFILDIERMSIYTNIEGKEKRLGRQEKAKQDEVIKDFLEFLGYKEYKSPGNPTEEEIARNKAAIGVLEEISFVCNQTIGNASLDASAILRKEEGYPLKLDDGKEFIFSGHILASKFILERAPDNKINLKYENIPKTQILEYVIPMEEGPRYLEKEGKSDFDGQVNISLTSKGTLEKVINGSWDYTLIEAKDQSGE